MPFDHPTLAYEGLGQYEVTNEPEYVGKDETIVVPQGFRTDLASVPRLFWALLPPFGGYEAAAVLHDYLCTRLALWWARARHVPRAERSAMEYQPPANAVDTDGLFRRVMRESGVGFCTRWQMWMGVRLGALANPARRAGWLRTAPPVVLILLIDLVILAIPVALLLWIGGHI